MNARHGRARRVLLRGVVCSTALCVGLAVYVYAGSEHRLSRVYDLPIRPIAVPSDPVSLERGRHLAVHVALCTWCHGDDLGGRQTADDPWIGRLHASNLTSGEGGIGDYSEADLARAIREGVTPEGRSLLLMPSHYFRALSDADVTSIIAWMRRAPPVDAVRPETRAGVLTRIALVAGLAPELITAEQRGREGLHPRAARSGAGGAGRVREAREKGALLADLGSCRVCHHPDLSGGLHPLALPGEPPPPDLRASGPMASWSQDDFFRAMRTGATPDGRHLDAEYMPWPRFAGMTDEELEALWAYLRS